MRCSIAFVVVLMALAGNVASYCWAGDVPLPLAVDTSAKNPPELGDVKWIRGFDAAAARAKELHKPVLVLFQEVPGCSTCVNYGSQVLSHPLIVEAAESLFVPVCVYNNIDGDDGRTLKRFNEPAWNNPVVRIMTADGKSLTDRVAEEYTLAGIASAMCKSIEKSGARVPLYLKLLAEESISRKATTQKATIAMHCFWEGEGALGSLDGVIGTLPGFVSGQEVVEVEFDPSRLSYSDLLKHAKLAKCASKVFARSDEQLKVAREAVGQDVTRSDELVRPDKEPKYYLLQTSMRFLPMTPLQAARINSAIAKGKGGDEFLSPRQRALLHAIEANPNANWPVVVGKNLNLAWPGTVAVAAAQKSK